MAVTADVDIANLALARLGQDEITTLTAGTRDATIVNRVYTQNRDYCLGLYNWVQVTQNIHLTRAGKVAITAASQATPPTITCAAHDYAVGDAVTIEEVNGMTQLNSGTFVVHSITTDTIVLYTVWGSALTAASYDAYTSGGYVYHYETNDWEYVYDLPSNCLRVLEVLDEWWGSTTYDWKREKDKLYCNLEYAALKYLVRETDPTKFDTDLTEFMVARLAWMIAPKVTSDETVIRNAQLDWVAMSQQARIQNAKTHKKVKEPEALWTSRG